MLKRSTIFLGLMLTGSLAAAALVSEKSTPSGEVAAPVFAEKSARNLSVIEPQLPALRLDKLARVEVSEPELDPFAGKSWYVPPSQPLPVEPVVSTPALPVAPPLPFRYMGRMLEENGHMVIYLTQGAHVYSVSEGDMLEGNYRLERIESSQLVLTYLPMNISQVLNMNGVSGAALLASVDGGAPSTAQAVSDFSPVYDVGSLAQ